MKNHLHLKPRKADLVIRDPQTKHALPVEGKRVPNNRFWRSRLSDGDVVEVESEAPKQTSKPKKGE